VNRALHRFAFSLHREVLEAGREGIGLLRAERNLWDVATLLGFMEVAALELGQIRLATELGEEADRLGTRLGHTVPLYALHETARAARLLAAAPDLAEFEAFARRHLSAVGDLGFRHMSGTFLADAAF